MVIFFCNLTNIPCSGIQTKEPCNIMAHFENRRAILLVLDSVGIGAMPDANEYNDPPNCFTLGNVATACQGLYLPNLQAMGLGNIAEIEGVPPISSPNAAYGRMAEKAPGKDTTTGHWEMSGVILEKPLALFPDGFSQELIGAFSEKTGRGVLGNCAASGTEIIARLGEKQKETGSWIVYTSADSVFQIAAHEDVIPLDELYKACEIARELVDPIHVGRVIARPFVGEPGAYVRTANRKDYATPPPGETILDRLSKNEVPVVGVGKIGSIFNYRGIQESHPTKNNDDGIKQTFQCLEQHKEGLLFVNLVDFDSKFGHRNNPEGYGNALEEFDKHLGKLLETLSEDDLLIITADHGCDPTVPGTDHSREYVPLLVRHSSLQAGTSLETRATFADIAQSLASFWGVGSLSVGTSFLPQNAGKPHASV